MSQSARPVSAKNVGELQQPQVGARALGSIDSVSAIKFDPRGNPPKPTVRTFGLYNMYMIYVCIYIFLFFQCNTLKVEVLAGLPTVLPIYLLQL